MSNIIFIIGNGFDLDLGLKTKFSDFAHSKYWPEDPNAPLCRYLDRIKDIPGWFDLEFELYKYVKNKDGQVNREKGRIISIDAASKLDLHYFESIHTLLYKYLEEEQANAINNSSINRNSCAYKLLKLMAQSTIHTNIYSFNYTNLNYLLNDKDANLIVYDHIHGSIKDKSIILGVNDGEEKLLDEYADFQKTMNKHYRSHDLKEDLENANEIIFFGLAMGEIDFPYFKSFFLNQSDGKLVKKNDKKNITIFTKDEDSRRSILKNLSRIGVVKENLFAQSNLNFIKTTDSDDSNLFDKFYNDLKEVIRINFIPKVIS